MKKTYKPAANSRISISELMQPSHSNFNGKIHGGYILNLMDQIAFA
ncbi:MAG: acyl-CoA thioesterase, partial [Xanthomarina gelatinilytica]|nr:acyl-CoA thioesterase [Xanthomarina gelatinilytica]